MNYYPLFRVRSWNNGVRCMSICILMTTLMFPVYQTQHTPRILTFHSTRYQHSFIIHFGVVTFKTCSLAIVKVTFVENRRLQYSTKLHYVINVIYNSRTMVTDYENGIKDELETASLFPQSVKFQKHTCYILSAFKMATPSITNHL